MCKAGSFIATKRRTGIGSLCVWLAMELDSYVLGQHGIGFLCYAGMELVHICLYAHQNIWW